MDRERDIEQYLTRHVKEMDGLAYKWVSPGNAGVPDRLIILPGGRIWFVELKTERGVDAPIQEFQQNRLRSQGCHVRVVRSMEDAKRFIRQLEEGI